MKKILYLLLTCTVCLLLLGCYNKTGSKSRDVQGTGDSWEINTDADTGHFDKSRGSND